MEHIAEKMEKHENALTKLLRKIIKQKDDTNKKLTDENAELREMLKKQQELIIKLNNENVQLCKENLQLKNVEQKGQLTDREQLDILEQNKSLKEQLLVSQNHNSIMAKELTEAKSFIRTLKKKLPL